MVNYHSISFQFVVSFPMSYMTFLDLDDLCHLFKFETGNMHDD